MNISESSIHRYLHYKKNSQEVKKKGRKEKITLYEKRRINKYIGQNKNLLLEKLKKN